MTRRLTALTAVLITLCGTNLAACSSVGAGDGVVILAPWTGAEGEAFGKVLDAFTAKTDIGVNYQGTRAWSEVLMSNVEAGTPPDVAVLASPGELANYARDDNLLPLDGVVDDEDRDAYDEQWLLPLPDDDGTHIYGVPLKAQLKSIIWFNPRNSPQPTPPPRTWDDLSEYSATVAATGRAPWCMGVGDSPSSGWPGADMMESILLRMFGPVVYAKWAAGQLAWTSPEVREAWRIWGEVATRPGSVHGGATSVLLTDFGDAGRPMFTDPPGCYLEHQASFITGFYRGYQDANGRVPRPGVDFDFFPLPSFGHPDSDQPFEVSADWAGMFNNTPQARALINFLATEEAQQIWPAIEGSSAFTVNKDVDPGVYGDKVSQGVARILNSDGTLCFDAADLMPGNLRNAFYGAVLDYLSNPERLEQLLTGLESVREEVASEGLTFACGQ
jgi:alpha-glucoside transport system substrate-binding protein